MVQVQPSEWAEMAPQPLILLIDDDTTARLALAEVLEGAGFAVTADPDAGHDLVVSANAAVAGAVALVKPVRVGSLLAAIRESLAEAARPAPAPRIGRWRFDEGARLLEDEAGRRVRLTDKEAAILGHLHRAGGNLTRETLLAEIWGYSAAITTHTLETHIYRLRQKIERDPARAELLLTEPGGYRLAV